MLILIGTVPTAYALNHAVSPMEIQDYIAASEKADSILSGMWIRPLWEAIPAPS